MRRQPLARRGMMSLHYRMFGAPVIIAFLALPIKLDEIPVRDPEEVSFVCARFVGLPVSQFLSAIIPLPVCPGRLGPPNHREHGD